MKPSHTILKSWEANAANWIQTVENEELESRRVATNQAIVEAVLACRPHTVLDLGCGEGWLSRTLRGHGLSVYGTDGIRALVNEAIGKDGEYYFWHSYEDIVAGRHSLPAPFHLVVINFALFDKELTEQLFTVMPALLVTGGKLVIQTLHPALLDGQKQQQNGWIEETWAGLKRAYVQPYRWYYRTAADWFVLGEKNGFTSASPKDVQHPENGKFLSRIYIFTKNN